MTERVYLHVGAPKSGTTYLQRVLETNRGTLADAGVLLVGDRHLDRVHAAMVVREDPRLESLPEAASTAWQRLVDQVLGWRGERAVLSYELFAGASAEQVQRALADLDGVEVHVVITARDLAGAVPSAWQERLKFALTTPLERWRPRPESAGERAEWGWRTMDPAGVAARWGATLPPERVHVVTVPRSAGDRTELWHRFAAACELPVDGLTLAPEAANESLGVVAAELLRRVNGAVGERISGNRQQALWLRDTLAHGVLAGLGRERIGLTDRQFTEAQERAAASAEAIRAAGWRVHGDLDDLAAIRSEARTPGQVSEAELLDAATEAIAQLLLLVRERTRERDAARRTGDETPTGLRVLTAGVVRRVTAPRVENRAEELRARVAELEAEVARSRALHLRVGELTDVVSELLLPAHQRDERLTARAVRDYRGRSL
jgi:hypothetical protein